MEKEKGDKTPLLLKLVLPIYSYCMGKKLLKLDGVSRYCRVNWGNMRGIIKDGGPDLTHYYGVGFLGVIDGRKMRLN